MMIKKLLILILISGTMSYAEDFNDQDFDGVPDSLDQCPDTPFLNEVNAKGCTTKILMLPFDTETDSLVLALKFGYSIDDDFIGRQTQQTSKVRLTYYKGDWSYALRTGYYFNNQNRGQLDTSLSIKRRFNLTSKLRFKLSASLRLPTYDFIGNNTDFSIASSLSYYPTKTISLFAGVRHTFIQDEQVITPIQDINSFYLGMGYFFTKKFYINTSFAYAESKFTMEHAAKSIGGILYYDINKKWFTTLSFNQDIDRQDTHNASNFTLGYRFW